MVFRQKEVLLWKDSHRRMRGNFPPAKAPVFSALCYILMFLCLKPSSICWAPCSALTFKEGALQLLIYSLPASFCSLSPSLTNPLHRSYTDSSLRHTQKVSELITVTTTLRTTLNEEPLFKRMKAAECRGLTTPQPHRSSSRMENALRWLKWPSLHYISHIELMYLTGTAAEKPSKVLDHSTVWAALLRQ